MSQSFSPASSTRFARSWQGQGADVSARVCRPSGERLDDVAVLVEQYRRRDDDFTAGIDLRERGLVGDHDRVVDAPLADPFLDESRGVGIDADPQEIDARAFEGVDIPALRDSVFVIGEDREVRHGLALADALMKEQGGSLEIRQEADSVVFELRVPVA